MLYAIDKETKEHRIIGSALRVGEKLVEADDDGWIPWSGHGVPVPYGSLVDVRRGAWATHMGIVAEPGSWWIECNAYRPILDTKPETSDWDGNGIPGLPSVGCIVEAYDGGRWAEAEFLKFHSNSYAVFFIKSRALSWATDIRPAKSKDERAIDELAMDILDTVNRDGVDFKHHEKRIAERLYNMGYRKVE